MMMMIYGSSSSSSSSSSSLLAFYIQCVVVSLSWAVNPACECVILKGGSNRKHGTFTSPNYPQVYSTGINCILYTFIGRSGEIVEITFLEFDIQVPVTNRCTDYLRFFLNLDQPEVNEQHQWNYELCGNISMITKRHYSSSSNLIIEFHTDLNQGNNTGFRGIYKFLDKNQYEIVGGSRRWGAACTYDFTSSRDTHTGRFFSPLYPQNYPPSSNCQYIFYGKRHERASIYFQNIQLEFIDGSCADSPDYIEVRDGPDATSPVIARFCNTLNGEEIFSSGDSLFVDFVVDARNERQGFAATYRFISEEMLRLLNAEESVAAAADHIVSEIGLQHPSAVNNKNNENTGDYPIEESSLLFLQGHHSRLFSADSSHDSNFKKSSSGCSYHFYSYQKKNGTFTSPSYPGNYPQDVTCRYTFQGQGTERVQIVFTDLDTHVPPDSIEYMSDMQCEEADTVTVSILIGGAPKDIGNFCGRKRPPLLMSYNTQMEVTFTSRNHVTGRGFTANYSFVTDYGIKSGERNTSMACGFVFRSNISTNGTFTSPNFPGLYPRNTECHYLFYGRENDCIYITFAYFDVEGIQPGCLETSQSDYVEFSNFNVDLMDRKMSRFCGTKHEHSSHQKKKEVNSDGNFFRVTFKSNDVYDATGFEAFYQFRKVEDPYESKSKPLTSSSLSLNLFSAGRSVVMTITVFLTTAVLLMTTRSMVLESGGSSSGRTGS